MASEQLLVLQMLADGKLSALQATELLDLLRQQEATSSEGNGREQVPDEVSKQARRSLQAEQREARRQIKQETKHWLKRAERTSSEAAKTVQSGLGRLGFALGSSHGPAFTQELSGKFSAARAEVRLQNTNGQISIEESPDNSWHLRLTVKVKAGDQAAARRLAESLVSVKQTEGQLTVESRRLFGQNAAVNIDLALPELSRLSLQASCTNGTIKLHGVSGECLRLQTVNGKVRAEQFQAKSIEAQAVNGGIWLFGDAPKVNCRAANGGIHVQAASARDAELELETVNGSITVILPAQASIGYRVDASSTAGTVKVDLPDVWREESKRPARRRVRAESKELKSKSVLQAVLAKSVSGKITISAEGGVL